MSSNQPTTTATTTTPSQRKSSGTTTRMVGSYIVESRLGTGSFAVVYLGKHKLTLQQYAIKSINKDKINLNKKYYDNLQIEIHVMKQMSHPHIVSLHEQITTNKHIYLVIEYCNSNDLSKYLRKNIQCSEQLAHYYFKQLVSGLYYLRQNKLIHRDLKPQNLLLHDVDGESRRGDVNIPISWENNNYPRELKIADFGFARHMAPDTMAATLCGSPLYMAPEILRYEKYDESADLWSAGVILYEMIFSKSPFNGTNHIQLLQNIEKLELRFPSNVQCSTACTDLLTKLLKRNPRDRIKYDELYKHPFIGGLQNITKNATSESTIDPALIQSVNNLVIADHHTLDDDINNTQHHSHSAPTNDLPKQLQTDDNSPPVSYYRYPFNVSTNNTNNNSSPSSNALHSRSNSTQPVSSQHTPHESPQYNVYQNNQVLSPFQLQHSNSNITNSPVLHPINEHLRSLSPSDNLDDYNAFGGSSTEAQKQREQLYDIDDSQTSDTLHQIQQSPVLQSHSHSQSNDMKHSINYMNQFNNTNNQQQQQYQSTRPRTQSSRNPHSTSSLSGEYVIVNREDSPFESPHDTSRSLQQQQSRFKLFSPPTNIIQQQSSVQNNFAPNTVFGPSRMPTQMQYTSYDRASSQPPTPSPISIQTPTFSQHRNNTSPTSFATTDVHPDSVDQLLQYDDYNAYTHIQQMYKRITVVVTGADKFMRRRHSSIDNTSNSNDNVSNNDVVKNKSITITTSIDSCMKALSLYCKSLQLLQQLERTIQQYKQRKLSIQQYNNTPSNQSSIVAKVEQVSNDIYNLYDETKHKATQCNESIENQCKQQLIDNGCTDIDSIDYQSQLPHLSIHNLLLDWAVSMARKATIAEYSNDHHECITRCKHSLRILNVLRSDMLYQSTIHKHLFKIHQLMDHVSRLRQRAEIESNTSTTQHTNEPNITQLVSI